MYKDLPLSHDTIKILEENIGSKIANIPCNNSFADMPPRARETKEKNKWDYIKLKIVCAAKETIGKMKREPIVRENVFANDTSDNV